MTDARLEQYIGIDIILDGWAKPAAERYLYELAGYRPSELVDLPAHYPYGKADMDCPYAVLAKGTPLKPRFRFTPDKTFAEVFYALNVDYRDIEAIPNG